MRSLTFAHSNYYLSGNIKSPVFHERAAQRWNTATIIARIAGHQVQRSGKHSRRYLLSKFESTDATDGAVEREVQIFFWGMRSRW